MCKSLLAAALLAAALIWTAPRPAQAMQCAHAVAHAKRKLAQVEGRLKTVPKHDRPRIRALLKEAKRLVREAGSACERAQSGFSKAAAAAKAGLAEGDIAAANALVKLD